MFPIIHSLPNFFLQVFTGLFFIIIFYFAILNHLVFLLYFLILVFLALLIFVYHFIHFSKFFPTSTTILHLYLLRVAIIFHTHLFCSLPHSQVLASTRTMAEDSLGLDKPIKLGRVSKIPRITDDLLLDRVRGLPHVISNYKKVARTIRKNDKTFAQKAKDSSLSKEALGALKVDTEVHNLELVLQFYQLWCHGLFPRATFSDCTQMIRKFKSTRIRMYRRELIDKEMHRQRVEKGIITEDAEISDDDLYDAPLNGIAAVDEVDATVNAANVPSADVDDDEDDWGFLSVRRRPNGLFIGDEDDEDSEANTGTGHANTTSSDSAPVPTTSRAPPPASAPSPIEYPDIPDSIQEDFDDKYDDELEIMREMGM